MFMKKIKYISIIIVFNCLLNTCGSNLKIHGSNIQNAKQSEADNSHTNFIASEIDRVVKKISGSNIAGEKVFNSDKSLSCNLKSWELIGVFKNNLLGVTQGEFVFEITNHAPKNQNWVIFELLILDEEGNVQETSNPFRDLQGEIIKINPPIEPGQTRTLIRGWKYRTGWHDVTLKSCQWADSPAEYYEKYPELENYLSP